MLDFCNTLIHHESSSEDFLNSPSDLEAFLKEVFNFSTSLSVKQYKDILGLRELLRSYFYDLIGVLKYQSLAGLNKWFEQHPVNLQVEEKDGVRLTTNDSFDYGPLLTSFYGFIRVLAIDRLKKCANPNCSHLFYDVSKNNKRQWCSMRSCGNIMKARAFHMRHKGKS